MLLLRRIAALLGLGLLGLSVLGLFTDRAAGQKAVMLQPQPPNTGTGTAAGSAALHSSIKITEDSRFRQVINVGRDCIRDEEWKQAVEALQAILNEKKDHYVQVREVDAANPQKETARWTSVKFEANNLLGSMKIEGLQVYEFTYGAEAKTKLDEAKKSGDRDALADVAQRFCHTQAGIEANELLATLFLARGQVFTAALRFEKLLAMNPENAKISDLTLFKAAMAFRRAGDMQNYNDTWKRIEANLQGKPGLKIGDDMYPVAKLDEVLKETPVVDSVNVYDWPMQWGNNRRTAQAIGSPPLLDAPLWKRPIMRDKLDGFNDEDPDQGAELRVNAAVKQLHDSNLPVLPGFFPIASQGVMVYRTQRGLCAVALKEIEIKDEESGLVTKIKPGQIIWKSIPMNRSLAMLLEKNNTKGKTDSWLDSYNQVPGFNSLLFENTMIGSLATDHRLVYAINDLAVPPHPGAFMFNQFNPQMNQWQMGELKPFIMQNELSAYDLITGKLKWELNQDDPKFKDSHFLSMPLSIGGKLYVLNERLTNPGEGAGVNQFGQPGNPIGGESELRIVCLDPNKVVNAKPEILDPIQVLGNVVLSNRVVQDIPRRVNAVHLAYGEGVLVCPTNAGEVFGIDLMTRSLVWSYPYRENSHQQIVLPGMNPNMFPRPNPGAVNTGTTTISKWKSSPPALQDGKVVFTAPDADSVHCVSLRDGKPLWRRSQIEGDLFMAGVFKGKVLIVGKTSIRALNLKDGSQLWSVYTGDLPAGQGVASKDIYYLPLKKGEILAVDIERGQVKAHNRAAVQGSAPGNLVFYEGMVLSQTTHDVMAYPQLSSRLASAKTDATNDPDNMTKLTDYGELLLKDGQVDLAVENLLKVFNNKPAAALGKRVNERLFEALTDLMQVDFEKASRDHLGVYKELTVVPGNNPEEQSRKSKYFRLVGQGREAQGNLVEAFQMYKDFGALPLHREGGIASLEDPNHKVPVNVWLRGRISGMIAKATEQQRQPLEAKIAAEWLEVDKKKDIDTIRSFVGMFDTPFKVGREARVRLAETIMERNERNNFLEAELFLHQVISSDHRAEPGTGGRALAALAHLEEKKGTVDSMKLAADYYRQLNRDFGKVAVRGAKTGSDLLNELATDKRFLPFLEETTSTWGPVKMTARDLGPGTFNVAQSGFVMQPDGDQTPFARQNRLLLDPSNASNPKVRLRELGSKDDRWATDLGLQQMNQQIFFHLYQQANVNQAYHPNARFRFYHVKGHLVVCQVGVMVYCLDGDTGKKLWELQTVDNVQNNGLTHIQQVLNDQEGNPEFLFWNQLTNQRFRVSLGRIGAVQASYVAIVGQKGLTVVDPLRGTILWKKNDVAMNSHVFGDDQYLFLTEVNDGGAVGVGRTLRANDGEVMNVPDFSAAYQGRVKVLGRQILTGHGDRNNYTLRLYDIITGKDLWSKAFPIGSFVLQSEDKNITGIVDPKGAVTILDVQTGKELVSSTLVQGRITPEDLKGLRDPLLLQDSERFYIALNKPIDGGRVGGGLVHNNFSNGTRCQVVNGWFIALHRADGQRKIGDRELTWKKGGLAWHSDKPMLNQMLITEQFEQSPIVVFTSRYNEILPNGGNRWVSVTQTLSRASGKWVYDSGPRPINGLSPTFYAYQMDLKSRTINLIGYSGAVQHYVDDGKGPPPNAGVMNPGGIQDGTGNSILMHPPNVGFGPNGLNVLAPAGGQIPIRIRPRIEVVPPIELPANPPR